MARSATTGRILVGVQQITIKIKYSKIMNTESPMQTQIYCQPLYTLGRCLSSAPSQVDMTALTRKVDELENRIDFLEHAHRLQRKIKRIRRKNREINRNYKCERCLKIYGSKTALTFHLRVKHQLNVHSPEKSQQENSEKENSDVNTLRNCQQNSQ